MRVSRDEFRSLPLEVHRILHDVPLQDVSAIDLPGGGAGRTIADVRALMSDELSSVNGAVRALFGLRSWLGRTFGWDAEDHKITSHADDSYLDRIEPEVRRRSVIAPGTKGPRFHHLYQLEREWLDEIRNATVHAFLAGALMDAPGGYRLYWGVYVRPITRWTPVYMAAIEPFRRFVVYPSILGRIRQGWLARYPSRTRASNASAHG